MMVVMAMTRGWDNYDESAHLVIPSTSFGRCDPRDWIPTGKWKDALYI